MSIINRCTAVLTAAVLIAGLGPCKDTPGGNSRSINRRFNGTVTFVGDHSMCIRPKPQDGAADLCWDDGTKAEIAACPVNAHWPDCAYPPKK